MRAALPGVLILALLASPGLHASPVLMSTNLCADALALELSAPGQLSSVYWQSRDSRYSSFAKRVAHIPANYASAEEALMTAPQVLLASRRWQRRMPLTLLSEAGIRVAGVPYPQDWPGISAALLEVGESIGRGDRAVQLRDSLEARLAALGAAGQGRSALYLRPNGGSAGQDTIIEVLFESVGLKNHAARFGLRGWGRVSVEALIADPPDLLMLGGMYRDGSYARSTFLRHPKIQAMIDTLPVLRLSHSDLLCNQWRLIDVAENLSALLEGLPEQGS
ncbi:hypothetical protein Q4485_13525 [Granulosicoccaceae sp. 1_MG-2023]|nr:hypothetical protein [Granulosicoccaceae sp. 1_MG-2023]